MRKILITLSFLFTVITSYSQNTTVIQGDYNTIVHNKGYLTVDSILSAGYIILPYQDTINNRGNITINPVDSQLYIKDASNTWNKITTTNLQFGKYEADGSGYTYTLPQSPIQNSVDAKVNGISYPVTFPGGNQVTISAPFTIEEIDKIIILYVYYQN